MTSSWTASLRLIHRTNTVLHTKHPKKTTCSGCGSQRDSMNRLFIHQMHPQVSRDIISEMSLLTHTHTLFQPTIWLMLQVVQREVRIISLLSPRAVPALVCHCSFFIICHLHNNDIITITSNGWFYLNKLCRRRQKQIVCCGKTCTPQGARQHRFSEIMCILQK